MFAAVWGSPLVADGKLYLGDEDGDVVDPAGGQGEEGAGRDDHGQLGVLDPGARRRRALHRQPQPARTRWRRPEVTARALLPPSPPGAPLGAAARSARPSVARLCLAAPRRPVRLAAVPGRAGADRGRDRDASPIGCGRCGLRGRGRRRVLGRHRGRRGLRGHARGPRRPRPRHRQAAMDVQGGQPGDRRVVARGRGRHRLRRRPRRRRPRRGRGRRQARAGRSRPERGEVLPGGRGQARPHRLLRRAPLRARGRHRRAGLEGGDGGPGPRHRRGRRRDAYVAGCDQHFRGVRVSDGKVVFRLRSGGYTGASPAVAGGPRVLRHVRERGAGRRPRPARMAWRYKPAGPPVPFYSSAALAGGRVVLGGRDKVVHALDAATGKAAWTFATRARVDSSPASRPAASTSGPTTAASTSSTSPRAGSSRSGTRARR